MKQIEFEIPLTIEWLNARQPYDLKARSPRLFREFLTLIKSLDHPKIADVGCGTGNHVLSISKLLDKDTTWYLIEREIDLLNEAKRRLKEDYSTIIDESEDTLVVMHEGSTITFHFCNELIETFLREDRGINAMIASALFDLFTVEEFDDMLGMLNGKDILLYSIMNYTGVRFDPVDEQDADYMDCFEAHMSRSLVKGCPMGAGTMEHIKNVASEYENVKFESEDSVWVVDETGLSFLKMNLHFYREGILSVLNDRKRDMFDLWFETKVELASSNKLKLEVNHQDFILKFE